MKESFIGVIAVFITMVHDAGALTSYELTLCEQAADANGMLCSCFIGCLTCQNRDPIHYGYDTCLKYCRELQIRLLDHPNCVIRDPPKPRQTRDTERLFIQDSQYSKTTVNDRFSIQSHHIQASNKLNNTKSKPYKKSQLSRLLRHAQGMKKKTTTTNT